MADFLKIDDVLSHLDIKEDMMCVEFGCGSANFTVAISKKLKRGKVYALDIQEEKLSALNGRLAKDNIANVFTVLCDLEAPKGSTFPDNYFDIALIPNMLFQAENKNAIISEGRRIIKSGGQLLIVDWLKKGPFSPRSGMITPDEVKKIASALGLSLKKEFAAGDYHYALIFTK